MSNPSSPAEYLQAQQAVIGSMLIDSRCIGPVLSKVYPVDFEDSTCRTVVEAISELWKSGSSVDPVIVDSKLGGAYHEYLAHTMALTPTAANALEYAELVKDGAAMSAIHSIAMELMSAHSVDDARNLLSLVESCVQQRSKVDKVKYSDGLMQLADWLDDPTPPQYLNWGIDQLNKRVAVEKGDFVVLGAESSTGKTALAVQLAFNLAVSGKRVGFFSLETNKEKIMQRNAAMTANVKLNQIKFKQANKVEIERIRHAARTGTDINLFIYNCPEITVAEIRGIALADRLDAVFVDYVQLVDGIGNSAFERVTEVSKAMHKMAQALDIMVVALSQVTPPSPTPKDWRPSMNDLRDSRQLKQDADVICLLSKTRLNSVRYFDIAKSKDSSTGHIFLKFEGAYMRFTPCDEDGNLPDAPKKAKPATIEGQGTFENFDDDKEPLPF